MVVVVGGGIKCPSSCKRKGKCLGGKMFGEGNMSEREMSREMSGSHSRPHLFFDITTKMKESEGLPVLFTRP